MKDMIEDIRLQLGFICSRFESVSSHPQVVSERRYRNYIRRKIVYSVGKGVFTSAWLCHPLSGIKGMPAVICLHGHGPGKDPLVGLFRGRRCWEYHKLISIRLAQEGFVTLTPDRHGYGEKSLYPRGYPTMENLNYLNEVYLKKENRSLFSLDISDALIGLQLLIKLGVKKDAIGCFGAEKGAFVAAGLSAISGDVASVCLATFPSDVKEIPINSGVSITPFLLFCLVAPKPLQIQIPQATPDSRSAYKISKKTKRYYLDKGLKKYVEIHCFDGVVEIDYKSAEDFFKRRLG